MKSFEEQFPRLRECRRRTETTLSPDLHKNNWRLERDIQKYCLDNQRVKEAINTTSRCYDKSHHSKEHFQGFKDCLLFIEKELKRVIEK